MRIHEVQHLTQVKIAHRKQREILITHMRNHIVGAGARFGRRPIDFPPYIHMRITFFEFLGGKKRFMRIKGFNLQKPVVILPVRFQKFKSGRKGLGLRKILHRPNIFSVNRVLMMNRAHGVWIRRFQLIKQHLRMDRRV